MRLFGLIGQPLTHSFSEKYFKEKFEREGLADCKYLLFPMRSIQELNGILQQNPGLEGLNVTIPYKQQVLKYLDSRAGIPEGLNACNCIQIRKGLKNGYNTDHTAFKKSLAPLLHPVHTRALILGNGGAAAAVRFALSDLGIEYDIVSRSLHSDSALTYDQLNENVIKDHLLIVNTTPLGMFPKTDLCPDIPYRLLTKEHLLYDLVYNPAKTLFLQKGEERGAAIKNGEEMLMLQAEESWRIWNS
jgi:shikimate dehydrogenase